MIVVCFLFLLFLMMGFEGRLVHLGSVWLNCWVDYKIYEKVVDVTHRLKPIFYD